MKRKKYATGTAVKNYMEHRYTALQQSQINKAKAQSEAENNPWLQAMSGVGNVMMQYGISQGGFGESDLGQIGNKLLPIAGNMQFNYGGKVPVEVEGEEVAETPNGELLEFAGPTHENGGIDVDLEGGTEIFSERIKVKGKSMATRKKNRERKKLTLEGLLGKNPTDVFTKNALQRTEATNEKEEMFDMKVQDVISNLEGLADEFASGGTVGDPPTKEILYGASYNDLGREPFVGDITTKRVMNPRFKKGAIEFELQGDDKKTMSIPTTAAKAKVPLDMNSVNRMLTSVSGKNFKEYNKQLSDLAIIEPGQDLDIDDIRTVLTGYAKVLPNVETNLAIERLNSPEFFPEKKAYGGKVKYANGTPPGGVPENEWLKSIGSPYDFNTLTKNGLWDSRYGEQYNQFVANPPTPSIDYDDAGFDYPAPEMDFSGIEGTTSLPGADPMIAGEFADDFSDPAIGGNGNIMGNQAGDRFAGAKDFLNDLNIEDAGTFGDYLGMAGNLYSSFAPMRNTRQAFAASTPNINPYANFGEEGLQTIGDAKGELGKQKARQLKKLELSRAAALKRGRSGARGINQMRAMDLAATQQADLAGLDVAANYDQQMMGLFTAEAEMENLQDQVVMGGEGARDIADRQDLGNYYTQLGRDKATLGQGLQEMGKDMNAIKQNKVVMNLLNQLSKYGITVDGEGQLSVKTND